MSKDKLTLDKSKRREREVTLKEVAEMRKKRAGEQVLGDLKVTGVITVFDKHGKEKGKMQVTSINDVKEK